jgi:hypothetical protein
MPSDVDDGRLLHGCSGLRAIQIAVDTGLTQPILRPQVFNTPCGGAAGTGALAHGARAPRGPRAGPRAPGPDAVFLSPPRGRTHNDTACGTVAIACLLGGVWRDGPPRPSAPGVSLRRIGRLLQAPGPIELGKLPLERRLGKGETGGTRGFRPVVRGAPPCPGPDARANFSNVMDGTAPEETRHETPPGGETAHPAAGVRAARPPGRMATPPTSGRPPPCRGEWGTPGRVAALAPAVAVAGRRPGLGALAQRRQAIPQCYCNLQ